ncbi:YciI family protein [Pseudonocardia aurantiaca]|uniref:YciI family protein n=1 Tax=Pseudonocardia aurantiaca TaxID=75290 RepID=A0ABW4FX65_9PSEU
MKYLLLMYSGPVGRADDLTREVALLEVAESGEWLDGGPIADAGLTRTVRVRDGVAASSPGPFRTGPAQLAGYWVVDCEDVERAVELAARLPEAATAAVEVRPLMGPSGMEM